MCIYRINYINSISVNKTGIYSHMTTESPTELLDEKVFAVA